MKIPDHRIDNQSSRAGISDISLDLDKKKAELALNAGNLPVQFTHVSDYIFGEASSDEYISGVVVADGKETIIRITFFNQRVSIYEVRSGRYRGEEFLLFEMPITGSYPPSYSHILQVLSGIFIFPPTLRLQWAAREGLVDVALEALKEGADPNEFDERGVLPLDAIALACHECANELCASFRQLSLRDGCEEDAYAYALEKLSNLQQIRSEILHSGARDYGPFRQMIRKGDFDGAKSEYERAVAIDAITPNGTTLLIERMMHRDEKAVAWLLDHGANPDWNGCRGLSFPVGIALSCPHLDLDGSTELVINPFSAACIAGFPEGIDLLEKSKADCVNSEFIRLHEIFSGPFPAWVVARLNGSRGTEAVPENQTVMERRSHPEEEIAWLRKNARFWMRASLLLAAVKKHYPVAARILLERGLDPNTRDNSNSAPDSGETPLGAAIKTGAAELVAMLLHFGADPDLPIPNKPGGPHCLPLIVASESGNETITNLLRHAGARECSDRPMQKS